jgi:SAM-dependent methyltransferase
MGRLELRKTFGEDAELYDRVRPTYPPALYDELSAPLGDVERPRVLEIGCGTGQATAFHWLDPAIRVSKSAGALRPGGVRTGGDG